MVFHPRAFGNLLEILGLNLWAPRRPAVMWCCIGSQRSEWTTGYTWSCNVLGLEFCTSHSTSVNGYHFPNLNGFLVVKIFLSSKVSLLQWLSSWLLRWINHLEPVLHVPGVHPWEHLIFASLNLKIVSNNHKPVKNSTSSGLQHKVCQAAKVAHISYRERMSRCCTSNTWQLWDKHQVQADAVMGT